MNIKQSIKLSAIINKMDIKINNPKGTQHEVGADLIMQVVKNVYKAEEEIYNFVSDLKKITLEEAQEVDLMEMLNELKNVDGLKGFFMSALK